MKISIVTSYFNRKNLLINTLNSLLITKHNNFEMIIVDDGSSDEERLEDLLISFPFIKLIRIEPEEKWYINPCIPFNKGIKMSTGDIIILQNPECFHTDDIISFVNDNLSPEDYFVFGCYSLNLEKTNLLIQDYKNYSAFTYNQRSVTHDGDDGWYNHSVFRPKAYHFTSAIYKSKMDELNGFDERFANGYGYDDDELLHRIKKICNVKIIDKPLVLHQYHYNKKKRSETPKNIQNNLVLFEEIKKNENKIKVNN